MKTKRKRKSFKSRAFSIPDLVEEFRCLLGELGEKMGIDHGNNIPWDEIDKLPCDCHELCRTIFQLFAEIKKRMRQLQNELGGDVQKIKKLLRQKPKGKK